MTRVDLLHRPLLVTSHSNDSVISLDSDSSESEDAPESLETHHDTTSDGFALNVSKTDRSTDGTTTQGRLGYQVSRTSNHRIAQHDRPLRPLSLPAIFRSDSRVSTRHSRDGPSPSVDRQERVLSTLLSDTSLAGHNRAPSSTVSPPSQAAHPPPPPDHVTSQPELPPLLEGEIVLPCRIICHFRPAQQLLDDLKISWGVQYELARGVLAGMWTWDDVTVDVLEKLSGPNAQAAPQIHSVMSATMGGRSIAHHMDYRVANLDLWKEYDREQDAILEGQSRGLGLRGDWKGVPDWYGGRIEQVVRLSKSNGTFAYRLGRPALKKSTRFARFLGSRRILKVKLSKDLRYERDSGVREHLSGPFVLCGRVFVPFASKEGNAYMMEVNRDKDRKPDGAQGDDTRMSLWDFIHWHNPLALNAKQALSKWTSRFDLGLSTTVPALQFESRNIAFIEDTHSEAPHSEGEGTEVLTDGCGFINGAALTLISRRLNLPSRPTAVQGRVAGSKGLWILHPEDRSPTEPPRIWIRRSQQKIKLPDLEEGSAHVIFDLITQSSSIKVPARLNSQTIINLAENGVDSQVFQDLLHEGLTQAFTSLTQWDGPGAMPLLWSAVNNLGGVTRTRLQKIAHGFARVISLANRFQMDRADEDEDEDEEDEDEEDSGLHQTVLELIQAGFNPQSSLYLYWKMRYVVNQAMDGYLKKYHLEVRQSAEAFIVPDPFGVLEEGEIHFKSCQELGDPLTETNVYSIRGPVLVSRNPTMVASDIQKVKAVERDQLADYVNVVVFSTKGSRSLASLLAGGDYDGDTVMVNWAPSIVEKFEPPGVVDKPDGFENKYFEEHVEHVTSFHHRHKDSEPSEVQESFLSATLCSLGDEHVGRYSNFHSFATYTKGYSDPETIRLAYMFTTCLDSRKTGHRVRKDAFDKDVKLYGWHLPECLRPVEELNESSQNGSTRRNKALGPFVLDSLLEFRADLRDAFLSKYEKLKEQPGVSRFATADPHLLAPHQEIVKKLSEMESPQALRVNVNEFILEARRELGMIENHIKKLKSDWSAVCHSAPRKRSGSTRCTAMAALRKIFASGPPAPHLSLLGDIPAIRASYAYILCRAYCPTFAFAMASQDLCNIKARELGGTMLHREFAEFVTIPKIAVRTLSTVRALT